MHRRLKAQAAERGLTLSDYLRREMETIASYPNDAEIKARLAALEPVRSDVSSVELVQAGREERDAQLWDVLMQRRAAEQE